MSDNPGQAQTLAPDDCELAFFEVHHLGLHVLSDHRDSLVLHVEHVAVKSVEFGGRLGSPPRVEGEACLRVVDLGHSGTVRPIVRI